ncbi:MAG: M4 family metallopeptidase, partial [Kiritimatiellota bacterium]|nr:M4 family metallopeptidase [Kiritimatiellota bacterium]
MNTWNHRFASRLWLGGCLALLFALCGSAAWAQAGLPPPTAIAGLKAESAAPLSYTVDENAGTLTWLQGSFAPAKAGDPVESAYAFMEKHGDAFRITDPRAEFSVMLSKKGLLVADDHVYLEQRIKGIPVWGRRLGFHYDSRGMLYAVNGKYCPTPPAAKLTLKPLITAEQAVELALRHARTSAGKWPASVAPFSSADRNLPMTLNPQVPQTAELIYYPDSQDALRLSYLVAFFVNSPPGDWIYFVDALSGAILCRMNNIQTSGPAVGSGLDLFNNVISLNTFLDTDGKYKLVNTTKPMYTQYSTHSNTTWQGSVEVRDAQHATSGGSPSSVGDNPAVYDPDGDDVFTYGGSDPKNNYQPAVQCAKFASDTYDFFRNMWGRNSLDDLGIAMIGNIHWGSKYDNAMWTPTLKMTFFGDGSDNYWPHVRSLDTVTHEFTHGVTTFAVPSYGYIYITESGAINESVSDMAAVTHDYDNWNYGEDYHKDGSASRRFDDPTAVAQPQPKDMYDFYLMPLQADNGGV